MLELVQPTPPSYVVPLKNSRWEDFAHKYLESDTQTEAARAIGIDDSRAAQEARRLINTPEIRARIDYLESEQRKRALITEGAITEELAIIAFSNPLDYITAELVTDPEVIKVKPGVNPKQLRAISEIEVIDTAAGTRKVKFKLHSKTAALAMAMDLKGYGAKNKTLAVNGVAKKDNEQEDDKDESAEKIIEKMGLRASKAA